MNFSKTECQELAKKIECRLRELADADVSTFVSEDGEVGITDNHIDGAIEYVLELEDIDLGDVSEDDYHDIGDEIDPNEVEGIMDDIREAIRDAEEYKRNPLAYHGMSQRDFI